MFDLHDGCTSVTIATGTLLMALSVFIRNQYQVDDSGRSSVTANTVVAHLDNKFRTLLRCSDISDLVSSFDVSTVPFEWFCLTSPRGMYLRTVVGKHGTLHSQLRLLWFLFGVSFVFLILDFFRLQFDPNIRFFPTGIFALQSLLLVVTLFFAAVHLNVPSVVQQTLLGGKDFQSARPALPAEKEKRNLESQSVNRPQGESLQKDKTSL